MKLKVSARTEQEITFSIPQFNRTVFPRLIFYSRSSVQHIQPARSQHHGAAGPQKRLSDTHSTKRSKKKKDLKILAKRTSCWSTERKREGERKEMSGQRGEKWQQWLKIHDTGLGVERRTEQ